MHARRRNYARQPHATARLLAERRGMQLYPRQLRRGVEPAVCGTALPFEVRSLPAGLFEELEDRYPTEFAGLFEAFAEPWCDEAASAIYHALRRVSEERARSVGGHVFMRGVVDTMVAELACSHAACRQALRAAGTRASAGLAGEAAAAVERALDSGQRVGIDELAASLYTSRSKLCAVFKAETGESLGAYMRRRRMERAQDLLADSSLSIAQIAELLGFPQQAAFAQAFKAANGCSATAWRSAHR